MRVFYFMAVLAFAGLSTPAMAQVDTCATTIGDTSAIQALVEAQLEPCATLLEIGTIADSTRPSGQAGWAVKAAFLTCAAQVDSSTFFVGKCPSAFSIDNAVLEAPREAHNSVEISALLINEQGNTSVELLASSNGGEDWFQIAWTRSKGDGDNTYKWVWTTPKAGQYLFQVTVTDINGFAGRSNAVEVYMTADPALIILDNGSQQPRISYDGDLSGVSGLDIVNGAGQVVAQTGPRGEIPALLPPSIYYTRQEFADRPLRILKR